jgi:hypothetical protein
MIHVNGVKSGSRAVTRNSLFSSAFAFKIFLAKLPILTPMTRKGPKCPCKSAAFLIKLVNSELVFDFIAFIFHTFGKLILVESAFINTTPMVPPMTPPAACNTEKKATPPYTLISELGFMKRFPIITPATAVEATDAKSKLTTLRIGFSKQF